MAAFPRAARRAPGPTASGIRAGAAGIGSRPAIVILEPDAVAASGGGAWPRPMLCSNFVATKDNVSYGRRLSDALDNAHMVIDTSRNGNGPWTGDAEVGGGPSWGNPPGQALGTAPTTHAGLPRVDALLWVKRPGDSDGACRPGEPVAGQWWPEYALDLARRSS